MVKTKARSKGRTRWWLRLLRWLLLPPGLYLTLTATIVAVIYWRWKIITSWTNFLVTGTIDLFGWGLLFIFVALGTLSVMIWRRKLSLLLRYWHQSLGGIAFVLAIWGVLAWLHLGGTIGLGIIGNPTRDFVGLLIGNLRIAVLLIIGLALMAPRASFLLVTKWLAWLGKKFKGQLATRPVRRPKKALSADTVTPEPVETETEEQAIVPAAVAVPQRPDLKQVAQEVWKKYGESPNLVTSNGWRLPPVDILDKAPEVQFSQADNVQRAKLIEEALASYGVETKVVQINAGPTVTQFGVEPGWDRKTKEIREKDRDGNVKIRVEETSKTRVKVDRITSLANDLALALAAPSIRIEAPVPGKAIVGVEVPNTVFSMVSLRGVIETSVFQKMQARAKLSLALGKGAGGEAVVADLTKMPHLLIAGATGSGKTVCLNTLICCLLLYNTPNDVRFVMIDPKRVELTTFNSIPHLAAPVIVDTDKALGALRWLNQEMDRRYKVLATAAVRNIEGYNKKQGGEKMPYIVLVIDELADLMMAGGDEVEHILCRLAQLARAIGIHLVVATQRPSVDVVTGLIKANFPTRISFAVTSQVDSRTILDMVGAEKLLGSGDMLYMPTDAGKPKRLQGCFVSDAEAERLVYFWGNQKRAEAPSLNIETLAAPPTTGHKGSAPADSLLEMARQLAQEHPQISASFLQRRLRIGYPRAARLMEQLEEEMEKGEEENPKTAG